MVRKMGQLFQQTDSPQVSCVDHKSCCLLAPQFLGTSGKQADVPQRRELACQAINMPHAAVSQMALANTMTVVHPTGWNAFFPVSLAG